MLRSSSSPRLPLVALAATLLLGGCYDSFVHQGDGGPRGADSSVDGSEPDGGRPPIPCDPLTGSDCDPDQYCDFDDDAACGIFGGPGVCLARPASCLDIFMPVCGCDFVEYGNVCEANAAGVSVLIDGGCFSIGLP